jgi:hypothetical protein
MIHDGIDLETRLAALEARAPGTDRPPVLPSRGRRGRFAVSMAMAPVLALAIVATATAGGVVLSRLAEGYPGIENPGQPLAGAGLECMTPPEAAAFLAAHGFTNVDWQVETGAVISAGGGKGTSTTIHQSSAPEHGFVIPGSQHGDGQVIMVADQRVGATGMGGCFGQPMP